MSTDRIEYTDDQRAQVLGSMLAQAELSLGLGAAEDQSIKARVDNILGAAQSGAALEPHLYRQAWFIRSTLSN